MHKQTLRMLALGTAAAIISASIGVGVGDGFAQTRGRRPTPARTDAGAADATARQVTFDFADEALARSERSTPIEAVDAIEIGLVRFRRTVHNCARNAQGVNGTLQVRFQVNADGTVAEAVAETNEVGAVGECVLTALRALHFDVPAGATSTGARYTWRFQP